MKARPSPQSNKATDSIFYGKALFSASYPQPCIDTAGVYITAVFAFDGTHDNAKLHCPCTRSKAIQQFDIANVHACM